MANKYSKTNSSSKAREQKYMEDYEKSRNRLNKGARIMALVMAGVMIIFAFVGAIAFMF
ncbi:MAG: hypothetical protein KBS63_01240 [Clostridiales bacterium]|nr:hypothetical protein [Candidatus Crickella caballi]